MLCEPVIVQPTVVKGPLAGTIVSMPAPQAVVTAPENSCPSASIVALDGVTGSILVLTPGI